jgi:hypothetical protein|tara:strand:- start:449 stop:985 length:537 start_codon:yes stop_codon:yes gene_type:complete
MGDDSRSTIATFTLAELRKHLTTAGYSIGGIPFPEGVYKYDRIDLSKGGTIPPGEEIQAQEINARFGIVLGSMMKANTNYLQIAYVFDKNLEDKVVAQANTLHNDGLDTNDGYNPWCIKYCDPLSPPIRSVVGYRTSVPRFFKEVFKVLLTNKDWLFSANISDGYVDVVYIPAQEGNV